MTDAEIEATVAEIKKLATRIGCEFTPDPAKIEMFKRAQRTKLLLSAKPFLHRVTPTPPQEQGR